MEVDNVKSAIILTTQRTGSTYLCYYLNNHPSAYVYNEVFLPQSPAHDAFRHFYINNVGSESRYNICTNRLFYRLGLNPLPASAVDTYLTSLTSNKEHSAPFPSIGQGQRHWPKDKQVDIVGFKLMYNQLRFFSHVEEWAKRNNTAIIHLKRRNLLKNYISEKRMQDFGVTHSYLGKSSNASIHFDYREFERYAQKMERNWEYHREMFANTNPYLEVFYEELFGNRSQTTDRILTLLELEHVEIAPPELNKVSSSSLKTEIHNHEEARTALGASKYASMLEDFE